MLRRPHRAIFAPASVLLAMYGLFLNLAPVEFATVTGIYLAPLFIAFQIVNYIFFWAHAIGSRPAWRRVHRCWCCEYLFLEIDQKGAPSPAKQNKNDDRWRSAGTF
jgi:hypothetical protein